MRFEGMLLTERESRALIAEVNAWCRRTGTNYNKLVIAAGVNVSTRSSVRNRGRRLTTMVADRLRTTMRQFHQGISKEQHKAHLRGAGMTRLEVIRAERTIEAELIEAQRVDRTPCPRCGVRADIGCQHSQRILSAMRGGTR